MGMTCSCRSGLAASLIHVVRCQWKRVCGVLRCKRIKSDVKQMYGVTHGKVGPMKRNFGCLCRLFDGLEGKYISICSCTASEVCCAMRPMRILSGAYAWIVGMRVAIHQRTQRCATLHGSVPRQIKSNGARSSREARLSLACEIVARLADQLYYHSAWHGGTIVVVIVCRYFGSICRSFSSSVH